MVTQKKEFRVWVWDKEIGRYLILPNTLRTYDQAVLYLEKYKNEHSWHQPNFDYSKFQIKSRIVSYSDWNEEFYE